MLDVKVYCYSMLFHIHNLGPVPWSELELRCLLHVCSPMRDKVLMSSFNSQKRRSRKKRDCKLKMVFPQQKQSQRESRQGESRTTHLLCRWLNDVPECSLAALWLPCGALLKVSHPQCFFPFPQVWRGKSSCVLPLCINYTCGMWVSDWN